MWILLIVVNMVCLCALLHFIGIDRGLFLPYLFIRICILPFIIYSNNIFICCITKKHLDYSPVSVNMLKAINLNRFLIIGGSISTFYIGNFLYINRHSDNIVIIIISMDKYLKNIYIKYLSHLFRTSTIPEKANLPLEYFDGKKYSALSLKTRRACQMFNLLDLKAPDTVRAIHIAYILPSSHVFDTQISCL